MKGTTLQGRLILKPESPADEEILELMDRRGYRIRLGGIGIRCGASIGDPGGRVTGGSIIVEKIPESPRRGAEEREPLESIPIELDADGYPTAATLDAISACAPDIGVAELLDMLREIAEQSAYAEVHEQDGLLTFSTGGWSGNEDLLAALSETIGWLQAWESSHRGGRHVFRVPGD